MLPAPLSLYRTRGQSPEDLEYMEMHEEMKLNLIKQYTVVDRIINHTTHRDEEGVLQSPRSLSFPVTNYSPSFPCTLLSTFNQGGKVNVTESRSLIQ